MLIIKEGILNNNLFLNKYSIFAHNYMTVQQWGVKIYIRDKIIVKTQMQTA